MPDPHVPDERRVSLEDFERRLVAVEKILADIELRLVDAELDKAVDTFIFTGDAGKLNKELVPEALSQQKRKMLMHTTPTPFGKQSIVENGIEQIKQDIKNELGHELLGTLKDELRKLVLGSNHNAMQHLQMARSEPACLTLGTKGNAVPKTTSAGPIRPCVANALARGSSRPWTPESSTISEEAVEGHFVNLQLRVPCSSNDVQDSTESCTSFDERGDEQGTLGHLSIACPPRRITKQSTSTGFNSTNGSREIDASAFIRDKFFNPQHRAYAALKDVERHTSAAIGRVLKRAYATWLLIAVLLLSAFMCWGFYKVINTTKYTEIHSEEYAWVSGSMALPSIAYKILTPGFSVKVQSCIIPAGNYSARHCEDVMTQQCMVRGRHGYDCFPAGLNVEGTFGDPTYRYVALDVVRQSPSATNFANVEVAWDQQITLFHKVSIAQLYAGGGIAHEIFFQKVMSVCGTPIGFAGRQGRDESEQLLASENAMVKAHEYSRLVYGYANSSQILSVFFRAHWSHREDFYESYSILKLLESSGGLWTSVLSIISLSAWTAAFTCTHCASCFRCFCRHTRKLGIRQ